MPTKPKSEARVGRKAAPKAAGKKPAPARAAARSKARIELLALLPELDEEGIAFLLEQARVHRYNMEVDRLNAIADRAAEDDEPDAPGGSSRAPVAARSALRLERSKDGSTYHIVCGPVWKMFTAEEIASFCSLNYGVSFPLMEKIEVNGPGEHPVYAFLKSRKSGAIKWNFTKFLVGRDGSTVTRFESITKPEKMEKAVAEALGL